MSPGQSRLPVHYDLYCTACPHEQQVTSILKSAGCALVQRLEAAAQYHYEGAYGVTIIYVAGYDASPNVQGTHPPKHAGRFYIKGNTDPRSHEQLQRVFTALTSLPVPFLKSDIQQQVPA